MTRRSRRQFSAEFEAEAVRLVGASDVPLASIAAQLGVSRSVLTRWVTRTQRAAGSARPEDEQTELQRLRREVLQLRMERDILKNATAFFARHSE